MGETEPLVGDFVGDLATLHAAKGNHDDVLRLASRAAAIHERAFGTGDTRVIMSHYLLAMASQAKGELKLSLTCWSDLFSAVRQFHVQRLFKQDDRAAMRSIAESFAYAEVYETLFSTLAEGQIQPRSILGATHLALDKALLEEVRAAQTAAEVDPQQATRDLTERHRALEDAIRGLAGMKLYATDREARLRELQSQLSETESNIAQRVGLVERLAGERKVTLVDIARKLPANSALLDFVQYRRCDLTATRTIQWKEQRYAVYVTFPQAEGSTNPTVDRLELGEAAPINAAAETVGGRMSAGQYAAKDLTPALQKLSESIYAPLAKYLTNVSHLIICPDGQLSRLPFEMLSHDGRFLNEDKVISYVGSGREIVRLARSAKPKVRNSEPLVMGNPDFNLNLAGVPKAGTPTSEAGADAPGVWGPGFTQAYSRDYRGIRFSPLPGAEAEARNVAKLLGGETVLKLGADAREAALKAVVSPEVLHLVTHGFFLSDQDFRRTNGINDGFSLDAGLGPSRARPGKDWENPLLRCGIALAGANHAGQITNAMAEDGLLTGLEASLLNLQGTELVILSACNTGSGEVMIGEGVMSLRRAFRIAGAETVLASHWKVSDEATRHLMAEFMRRWRAGEPRAEAWHQAQLSLLHSKEFSNPYFWASFTLTGQWR